MRIKKAKVSQELIDQAKVMGKESYAQGLFVPHSSRVFMDLVYSITESSARQEVMKSWISGNTEARLAS